MSDCTHTNVCAQTMDQTLGVVCNDCGKCLGYCWMDNHFSEAIWNRACATDPELNPCDENRDDHCALCGEKF